MPGPPPPPPMGNMPPPPPPMGNLNNNSAKKFTPSTGGGGDMRGALLSQIQKGTTLKKVTTVDKSKPKAGRIADSSSSSSPTKSSPSVGSTKTSPDSSTSSPIRQGGFTSLTDELQHKLTLKKNKNSPLREARSIVEPKESSPPSVTSSSKSSFVNEIKSKQSVISPQHQLQSSTVSSAHVVSDAIPNKSSLFNNNLTNNNNISNNNSNSSYDNNKSQPSAPKINHGKPNLAPKPPPQLSLPVNSNSSSNSLNDGNRKSVARHQSMKSPRSPPIGIAPTGPTFNNDNHFGTIRNPSSQNKMQEALNLQVVQKPVAQRPTNKPPPPPVPNRNLGTNLTQSHAKSTTALNNTNSDQNLSAPRRIPNSGSSNNISNMERNIDATDSTAPPLPPHRMSSAQKLQQQQQQSIISQVPPEVPRRHSSMRQSIENGGGSNKYPSPNPNQPPAPRLVVDLEARYSLLFHSMSEFPAPKPFINVDKSYPSKAVRPANGF